MIPGLGAIGCRRLVESYPEEDIFALSPTELRMACGDHVATAILNKESHAKAEKQYQWAEKHGIRTLFFTDPDYPSRLNRPETRDCPVLLYVLGTADLNSPRTAALVGTRKATPHGRDFTAGIVARLTPLSVTVVSGLAYGIDTAAHQASVDNRLTTIAVLGHGLDNLYPPENRKLAAKIIEQGGALVTEYPMGAAINPSNFPTRNRIIAALSDCTLVMEASQRGGALITASIAEHYRRPVFAVPGRPGDTYSLGTNQLIATGHALMLCNVDDITRKLGWTTANKTTPDTFQATLPLYDPQTQKLIELLRTLGDLPVDTLANQTGLPLPQVTSILFNLEVEGTVSPLPGQKYHLIQQ